MEKICKKIWLLYFTHPPYISPIPTHEMIIATKDMNWGRGDFFLSFSFLFIFWLLSKREKLIFCVFLPSSFSRSCVSAKKEGKNQKRMRENYKLRPCLKNSSYLFIFISLTREKLCKYLNGRMYAKARLYMP